MNEQRPTREEMETAFRRLLADADLPQPDAIVPHEDGGILCRWDEQRLVVVIDPE